ncbi:MAG TPA: 2OG-Fe(II) oxygenase [Mucilaginibacter sp.]|jgi:hypothetical protein|nr:2OG-Fe(II) oxygenase [Mucilaginibacter sp.]
MDIQERIKQLDWASLTENLNGNGYAATNKILNNEDCAQLISQYCNEALYRKTVNMARHNYGLGEYKYFNYPLPPVVQALRESIYPNLAPIANNWMRVLNIDMQYPAHFEEFMANCHAQGQNRPTPLILKYGKGGFNTLHQDLYGDIYFPLQAVVFLTEPGIDYDGGEFVLIEQRPRAQSKALVLKPQKGDMLIFTTNFRPVQGSKGYYRVNMKHGVSELTAGNRYTLGIIFHDAA